MNWYEQMFVDYSVIFTTFNTIWMTGTIIVALSWFFDFDPVMNKLSRYDSDGVALLFLVSLLANVIFGLTWLLGGIKVVPVANLVIFSTIFICVGVCLVLWICELIINARATMIYNKRQRQRNG